MPTNGAAADEVNAGRQRRVRRQVYGLRRLDDGRDLARQRRRKRRDAAACLSQGLPPLGLGLGLGLGLAERRQRAAERAARLVRVMFVLMFVLM